MKMPIHKIENYTDVHQLGVRKVPVIKREHYFVDDSVSIDGDAPKKFIGIYDYQLLDHKHKSSRKIGFDILLRRDTNGIQLSP